MMSKTENFFNVASSVNLDQIFDVAGDKLVILMFSSKRITNCQRAYSTFETASLNHLYTIFCVVDMDRFEGDSRYTNGVTSMPRFDGYFKGNLLGSVLAVQDHEIGTFIGNCQRYTVQYNSRPGAVMQNTGGIGMQGTQGMGIQGMGMMPGMQNMGGMQGMGMSVDQMQQRQRSILNQLQMTNPTYFLQLQQNPLMLNQFIHQQMLYQQQAMQSMQAMPPIQTPVMPTTPAIDMVQAQMLMQAQAPSSNTGASDPNALPPLPQIQRMFEIFQMLQRVGALPIPEVQGSQASMGSVPQPVSTTIKLPAQAYTLAQSPAPVTPPTPPTPPTQTPSWPEGTITLPDGSAILPDGRQLVLLGNGSYGLVKKN
ncbi:Hypothetical protein MVR_LOCUS123 [uncultured virus]|nr:Hypothetical protein MVR_LOCUS123 [uncultured virus]